MNRTPISRGMLSTLLMLWLNFAASTVHAAEDTIKVGILHSLSGTMAISESVLKDTVLMLIADQNKKGGLLGKKLEPVVADPESDWDAFAEKAGELLTRDKVAVVFGGWTSLCAKGGSSHLRADERPALLSRSIRRRRKLPQHLLSGRSTEPAGHSRCSVPDEQGRRRRSPMGSARDRLSLSAQDQPDFERLSCGRGRVCGGHDDDLWQRRPSPTGGRSSNA